MLLTGLAERKSVAARSNKIETHQLSVEDTRGVVEPGGREPVYDYRPIRISVRGRSVVAIDIEACSVNLAYRQEAVGKRSRRRRIIFRGYTCRCSDLPAVS